MHGQQNTQKKTNRYSSFAISGTALNAMILTANELYLLVAVF